MGGSNSTTRRITFKNLVSAQNLASELFELGAKGTEFKVKKDIMKSLRILDASMGGEKAKNFFLEKSIPTSCFLDVQNDLKDAKARFPNTMPTTEIVKNTMERVGVNKDDHIILYAQPGCFYSSTNLNSLAVLTLYGFSNVKVLDGGFKKYCDENFPIVPGEEYKGEKSKISELNLDKSHIVDFEKVHDFALGKLHDYQMIDVRSHKDFIGQVNSNIPGCRAGHIPRSVNIPMTELFKPDTELMKSPEELETLFKSHGLDKSKNTIITCRSGMTATVGVLVFNELGYNNVQLYDGSWSEYGTLIQ